MSSRTLKPLLRKKLSSELANLSDKEPKDTIIHTFLLAHPSVQEAKCIFCYLNDSREVSTSKLFTELSAAGKRLVIPYISEGMIKLFRFRDDSELAPGFGGIPEPKRELRALPERQVAPDEVNLFIIPGLAFDRSGTRLGRGAGHFDRFLVDVSKDALRIGLCYELQLLDSLPKEPHDMHVDWVITESGVFRCG